MNVVCYICEEQVDIDHLVRHLHSHADSDPVTIRAHRRVAREQMVENAKHPPHDAPSGGEIVHVQEIAPADLTPTSEDGTKTS